MMRIIIIIEQGLLEMKINFFGIIQVVISIGMMVLIDSKIIMVHR